MLLHCRCFLVYSKDRAISFVARRAKDATPRTIAQNKSHRRFRRENRFP